MRVISRSEQVGLDAYLVEQGIPLLLLMEAAGRALAEGVLMRDVGPCIAGDGPAANFSVMDTVDLLAGPGMNGGDLYVAARKLVAAGKKVRLWEGSKAKSLQEGIVFAMRRAALAAGVSCEDFSAYVPEKTVVIDGILGTGFRPERALSDELHRALVKLARAKEMGALVLACDLPSGIVTDTGETHPLTVAAHETITFFAPKIGQMKEPGLSFNGRLTLSRLELPEKLIASYWHKKRKRA